jgi:hypothetical protein
MTRSIPVIAASLGLVIMAGSALAVETENNRQSPAPQGTTPPDRNAKAQEPGSADSKATNTTKEDTNTQSPGNAEKTDLTKKAEQPSTTGAPQDTQAPEDVTKKVEDPTATPKN